MSEVEQKLWKQGDRVRVKPGYHDLIPEQAGTVIVVDKNSSFRPFCVEFDGAESRDQGRLWAWGHELEAE